jgi:hypothetical protein
LLSGFILSVTGGFLSFLWERAAVTVLITAGLVQILLWRMWSTEVGHVVFFAMPSLALAGVLVLASRREPLVGSRLERV